ncbi:hypothetical protein V8F06_000845 [Rhypophila decipiens]
MPHLTINGATAPLDGVRPAEGEIDEVPADDAAASHHASPAKNTTNARVTGTRKGGPKGARTKTNAATGTTSTTTTTTTKVTAAGRRKKLFDTSRAQAAYERMQDLKQSFSAVQKALKAPLNEIADRSITELLEDPAALERTPEYAETQNFLSSRLADQQKQVNDRHQIELAMARHVLDGEIEAVNRSTDDQMADLCHEAYGQLLRQLDMLESLHAAGIPLDLPAGPEDTSDYMFKAISQKESDNQGPFIEMIDGAYVPVSGKPVSELMTKREEVLPAEWPKRKAEEQPDGQPAPKVAAIAKKGEASPNMARHPSGLLAAVEALEERSSETPPSNAPSPRPEPLDAPSPGNADQARTSGVTTPRDPLEIPVPRGATSPDDHGIRLINRKATQMSMPNNRIMVPMPFYWEDHEIGFRDSTNSLQKGATKARRGRYLDKPNSNYMFIDRRVGTWDSTNPEDEFDEALIKKHRLHPTLGIVLNSSINDWEPPKPVESGWKPVVLVAPDGTKTHASRTIPAAQLDQELQKVEDRVRFKVELGEFCKEQGIPESEVAPEPDILGEYRRTMLIARGMDPEQEISPSPKVEQDARESSLALAAENLAGFNGFVEEALQAAAVIDAEDEADRLAASNPSPQQAQSSRPYDAIRDVFTDTSPSSQPIQPVMAQSVQEAPPPPLVADTSSLSFLADAAEQVSFSTQPNHHPPQYVAEPLAVSNHAQTVVNDTSAIDPSLFGQGNLEAAAARPVGFERADDIRMAEYAHSEGPPQPSQPPAPTAGFVQQNDSDFLRTTLNPQPSFPSAAGPSHEYPPPPGADQDYTESPSDRTPFSNPGANNGNKGLPALRPVRGLLNDSPPPPEAQESPVLQHPNMVSSNSGAFYPPNPNRPFHTSFSVQEYIPAPVPPPGMPPQQMVAFPGPPVHGNGQGFMQGPPVPAQGHGQPPPPLASIYGSPPEYHSVPVHIAPVPIAAAPPPLNHGPSAPVPIQTGVPQSALPHNGGGAPFVPIQFSNPTSAATPSPRSRPGSSSNKYRKLEPAPTPPHRMGYPGSGQELRTVQFDYREQIKDYSAKEAPPRHGPTHIRGWTHNNQSNIKKSSSSSSTSRPTSKGDAAGTTTGGGEEPS